MHARRKTTFAASPRRAFRRHATALSTPRDARVRLTCWMALVALTAFAFLRVSGPAAHAADPRATRHEHHAKGSSSNRAVHHDAKDQPTPRSVPTDAAARRAPGADARTAWAMPPFDIAPRGPGCLFDNGVPLDDFGDPASQWSENDVLPGWDFIGAAADDFMIGSPGDPDLCRITLIRAAFLIDDNTGLATPANTWKSVFVTVYPNVENPVTIEDEPGGLPDDMGGQTFDYKVSQEISILDVVEVGDAGECRVCHVVDIPVNFLVKRGFKYWLSIVPRHTSPPEQSFWCMSENWTPGEQGAKQYFPEAGPPYDDWTDFLGNLGFCPMTPPGGTNRNLSFRILTAGSEPDQIGACCDESDFMCVPKSIVDCQQSTHRFGAGVDCNGLNPPCGKDVPGACCLPSGACVPDQFPLECFQLGGQWHPDACEDVACPPTNELCDDASHINGANISIVFDTTHAQPGSGLPLTGCGAIVQDIWYSYEVPCDGTVAIDTIGSGFDTVLAVYGPSEACPIDCPKTNFTEFACSDDIPNSTDSYVLVPALTGQCLLIRVGGKASAGVNRGPGMLNIQCIDDGFGACCHGDLSCDLLPQEACTAPGDRFFPGEPCAAACRAPENDACEDALPLAGDPIGFFFDTTNAMTEAGSPQTTCGQIFKDIWFSYEVPCDGTVTIRTQGSTFDTVLAVYGPAMECPVSCPIPSPDGNFSEWACNDDMVGDTDSYVVLPAMQGQCLLIRVGGKSESPAGGGLGRLVIDCIPEGFGACCHADLTCEVLEFFECLLATDLYTPGQPCVFGMTCPPPCCLGDMNDDCRVDLADVPLFVEALLDPSMLDPDAFCRADINRDLFVDALDIGPFVGRLLAMAPCVTCCPGDTNGDGLLNALDIQGLINALLDPPHCATVDFCRADVNEDLVIDMADLEALVEKLLTGESCP